MRTYHSGESGISIGMRRNLDQLQQDMPHDYCHRIDCQGLGDRDLSDLAHRILLNTTGVGAKVKLKLQSAN